MISISTFRHVWRMYAIASKVAPSFINDEGDSRLIEGNIATAGTDVPTVETDNLPGLGENVAVVFPALAGRGARAEQAAIEKAKRRAVNELMRIFFILASSPSRMDKHPKEKFK
ncbi:MAG: hypothetical protein ABSC61_03485 [Anaerolineales bacterium]